MRGVGLGFLGTSVPANATRRQKMEVSEVYKNKNQWVSVLMIDGMVYEGTINKETEYGIYLHIGGQEGRLSMFPWHAVGRVVFKI
jgi:sRNA-binding regulator protein Hfq